MLSDRIEGKWIDAFCETLSAAASSRATVPRSCRKRNPRQLNVQISPSSLCCGSARRCSTRAADPRNPHPVPVRSTGASVAIGGLKPVVSALGQAGFVVDCTLEGLMHAPETPTS